MENMEIKKVLITGGAGFIGSNLIDELIFKKYKVIVIDNLSSGKKENVNPSTKFYKADVINKEFFKIFENEKPNIVFHLAAQPIVEKAYEKPLEAIETNVMGTANVLEACRKQKNIDLVVIVSSDKAYGKSKNLPYKEDSPLKGDHPYDASKSSADLLAQAYYSTYNLPVVITRFSNVFGPRDTNFSRIIPGVIKSIIENKQFLIRSNGRMIREYTYIKDIVSGCIKLIENKDKIIGQAFNFGSKNIFSVLDIVKKIYKSLGVKENYKILNTAKNEIPEQYLDWTKAKNFLEWQPKISLDEGIEETYNWYKNYFIKRG